MGTSLVILDTQVIQEQPDTLVTLDIQVLVILPVILAIQEQRVTLDILDRI